MRRNERAQMMVMAAVMVAAGMSAIAFVTYSSMNSGQGVVEIGSEDAEESFDNLKMVYGEAAKRAYYQGNRKNAGPYLDDYARNISSLAGRRGYSVILLPRNRSAGFNYDNATFQGSVYMTDGTTTFKDAISVDLTD